MLPSLWGLAEGDRPQLTIRHGTPAVPARPSAAPAGRPAAALGWGRESGGPRWKTQHERRELGWISCQHAALQLQDAMRTVFGEEAALAGDGTGIDVTVISSRSTEMGLEIQLAWYSDQLRVVKVASVTAAEVAQGILPSESWMLNTVGEAMGFWVS